MGVRASAMNAIRLFPHPRPRASYMLSPASGKRPPTKERRTVFAATAEAAYVVYASMRYLEMNQIRSAHCHAWFEEAIDLLLYADQSGDDADAEKKCTKQRDGPLNMILCCPSIYE